MFRIEPTHNVTCFRFIGPSPLNGPAVPKHLNASASIAGLTRARYVLRVGLYAAFYRCALLRDFIPLRFQMNAHRLNNVVFVEHWEKRV